jgi:hypothetical protein
MTDSFESTPSRSPNGDGRPSSNAMSWLLGALLVAVLAVIGLLAVLVFRDDGESAGPSTTSPTATVTSSSTTGATTTTTEPSTTTTTTTTTSSTTTTTTSTTTSTTTTLPPPEVTTAREAADTFIAAVGSGDTASAWALLSATAQAAIGSFDAFDDLRTEFVEGFGVWRQATDVVAYENVMLGSEDGAVTVVTFAGEVTGEGITTYSTLALPVRAAPGGRYEVLWFVPAARTEFVVPAFVDPPQGFPADGTFEVLVPDTVTVVRFALDDLGAIGVEPEAPSGGTARAVLTPDEDLPSGLHVLTVMTVGGDVFVADAVPFLVE